MRAFGLAALMALAAGSGAAETPLSAGWAGAGAGASETGQRTASLAPPPEALKTAAPAVPAPLRGYPAALAEALADADLEVRAAYGAVRHRALWGRASGVAAALSGAPTDWTAAETLLRWMASADAHALPSRRDRIEALRAELQAVRARLARPAGDEPAEAWDGAPAVILDQDALAQAARLERALSEAAVAYAADLSTGALEPHRLRNIHIKPQRPGAAVILAKLHVAAQLDQALAAFEPQSRDYQQLKTRYAALSARVAAGGFGPKHAHRRAIRKGARGADIVSARIRLAALGYLPAETAPSERFDAAMDKAVRRFQAENGILSDGEIGRVTARELNRAAADRVRQLAVNLERARWHDFGRPGRHVRVNIPDYHMDVVDGGRSVFRSRVVVGKPKHATPEFSDEMTHVVVNPMWHVPRSIATKELLPQIRNNPGLIYDRNMRLIGPGGVEVDPWTVDWNTITRRNFPFRIQQLPGGGNALGDVKFIFPNRHAIYLHDTPSKRLFKKPVRAFSHGCVRVARPTALAELLLGAQRRNPSRYYRRLRGGASERYVRLRQRVPVHLLYRTAWVDEAGVLQSRRDIYGRDRRVAAALTKAGVALP